MRYVRLLLLSLVLSVVFLIAQGRGTQPVLALHHIAQISEVMSGFAGDPNVQFVEIDQLGSYQNAVANTRLTAFNADGSLAAVLLNPVGGNVSIFGDRWIMGTTAFEAAAGISADFIFSPGIPPDAGMVCWGAPDISAPLDPNTWDASDPTNYVDCVSYGGAAFTGTNPMSVGNPSSFGAGDDKRSLTRNVTSTANLSNPWRNSNDATDFKLADPSPKNDAGVTGTLVQPAPVGGIAELPEVAGAPLATGESSGLSAGVMAGIIAGATAGAIALGGAAWHVRRRVTRR